MTNLLPEKGRSLDLPKDVGGNPSSLILHLLQNPAPFILDRFNPETFKSARQLRTTMAPPIDVVRLLLQHAKKVHISQRGEYVLDFDVSDADKVILSVDALVEYLKTPKKPRRTYLPLPANAEKTQDSFLLISTDMRIGGIQFAEYFGSEPVLATVRIEDCELAFRVPWDYLQDIVQKQIDAHSPHQIEVAITSQKTPLQELFPAGYGIYWIYRQ